MLRFLPLLLVLLLSPSRAAALGVPLPRLPANLPPPVQQTLEQTGREVRRLRERTLLREHRRWLEADPRGAPAVRSEVVAIAPDAAPLARAQAAGFQVVRESRLAPLDLRIVVLRAPDGMRVRTALRRLARIDPDGQYDYNHIYLGSGTLGGVPGETSPHGSRQAVAGVRVGLVDGGVDASHPLLAGVAVQQWGCRGNGQPEAHGTAVASLLAGDASGGARGGELFAADIYCGEPTGGSVTSLAEAFAWLARERVAVINLSLVGPPNQLLESLVGAMQQRGHVLVAAVGNDGPAARPLYPAAYPGVIGVTAVDVRDRLLPEAVRGDAVDFAAPGSDLWAARPGGDRTPVRGTSFAAPLVARLAAAEVRSPSPGATGRVMQRLASRARDLGPRGRDPRFGHGLLSADARAAWATRMNED
ncbi:peptidase S8 [Arenimonas soli]|uniref:Peptidase S8 n=1 Tax=Arenimonas soli TaxID=2269504 RepID=A0ABQ1HNF0_9GAMM|nr:S8 family serine peptidase [Arenimonas soli]GGA83837.1 peptidase S8 [Arenimonas soli]